MASAPGRTQSQHAGDEAIRAPNGLLRNAGLFEVDDAVGTVRRERRVGTEVDPSSPVPYSARW